MLSRGVAKAVVLLALAASAVAPVRGSVLTFEEAVVSSAYPSVPVPDGYGGLIWSTPGQEIFSMDGPLYFSGAGPFSGVGFAHAPVTGPKIAWSSVQDARISLAPGSLSFDFIGAYFTQASDSLAFDGIAQEIWFTGKAGATTFTSPYYTINISAPQFLAPNGSLGWTGLDELVIHNSLSSLNYPWAMDDFTYTLNTALPAAPLPPAFLLFASAAVLLLAGVSRTNLTRTPYKCPLG